MRLINMDQQNQAVENKTENAAAAPQTQGVENNSSVPAPADDPEVKLQELLKENDKLRNERDNYRNATKAVRGKLEEEDFDLTDPVQLHAYINKKVDDKLLENREAQTEKELVEFAKELARKNKELAIAVSNRSQIASVNGGSGATGIESKNPGYWSPDQAEELKKRWKKQGIPDERIEKMLLKAEENSRRSQ